MPRADDSFGRGDRPSPERHTFRPPPGGVTADGQAEVARYGDQVAALPGLISYIGTLSFPASREALLEQVGGKQVYIVPDYWMTVADILRKLPDEEYASAADLKELVAANWPSISPRSKQPW